MYDENEIQLPVKPGESIHEVQRVENAAGWITAIATCTYNGRCRVRFATFNPVTCRWYSLDVQTRELQQLRGAIDEAIASAEDDGT